MAGIYPKSSITTICVNTVDTSKILYLPAVSTIPPGGLLYIKDICGNAATSCIILSTTGLFDTIDNNTTYPTSTFTNLLSPSYTILSTNGVSALLTPDGRTNWIVLQNNVNNPIYGRLGYSSFLYTYFYTFALGSPVLSNGVPSLSQFGPGNQGWFYPLYQSTIDIINFTNFSPPGNRPGTVNSSNDWGFGGKGYIYSASNTTIQFQTVANDGMIVYFNRSTVISNWATTATNITTISPPIPLNAGYNPLAITYFQRDTGNRSLFSWAIPASSRPYISNGTGVIYYNESSKYWTESLL